MERRHSLLLAVAVMLCGCGQTPASAPTKAEDIEGTSGQGGSGGNGGHGGQGGQSGTDGTAMAGSGGMNASGGTGGTGATGDSTTDCPAVNDTDGGTPIDAATMAPTPDGDDAGADLPNEPMPDADAGTTPRAPRTPHVGEVIVSEVMLDPTVLSDAVGEWFELHNNADIDLTLTNCTITDAGNDDFRIGELVIAAHSDVVFGRTAQAAGTVDYVYSGMTLTNTADEVILTCDDELIDGVAYGPGFPRTAGRSMQLSTDAFDAAQNDLGASWCSSSTPTPGAPNSLCAN